MAKKSGSLTWSDSKELAFRLIDEYPQVDPSKISQKNLIEFVKALPDFADSAKKPNIECLQDLRDRWFEERTDMEDELGPLEAIRGDEELDEDEYRDDRLVEESDDERDEDDDNDTISFDEAFNEDDEDEDDDLY